MKCIKFVIYAFLLILPNIVLAGWEVARPSSTIPCAPIFQASAAQDNSVVPTSYGASAFPNKYAKLGKCEGRFVISISGSLKDNLERIVTSYGWKLVWQAPYDYNFDGRVIGCSMPNAIAKLMKPFPLQAVMYLSNKTILVIPRKVC